MLMLPPSQMRAPHAIGATVMAPVGGWNTRDSLADMKPQYATCLDNYFPEGNYLRLRNGYAAHATGISGAVQTVMEWSGPSSSKLFAANATAIYDVSAAGAVGSASLGTLTSGWWQHVNFTTAGGSFLVICNGADSVRNYNGSTWSTPAITGATSSTFISVCAHKGRLWFVQKDTTKAWYLPAASIAGAAVEFDLGSIFQRGGKLKQIGSVSTDAGNGPDDFLAFISSHGEIALYAGTDPASATTWSLVGRFLSGAPVGYRSLLPVSGDLAMISEDGVVSVQRMMQVDRQAANSTVTDAIADAFSDAFQTYGSLDGWQAIAYPRGHMALINVPQSSTTAHQYVMNTQTGAWCRFKGMNAYSWGLFGEDLYFGGTGGVWKADTGNDDGGSNITGDICTAYSSLGGKGTRKRYTMARCLYEANGPFQLAMRLDTDYAGVTPSLDDAFTHADAAGSLWGTAIWGTDSWGGSRVRGDWLAVYGEGYAAAVRVRTVTKDRTLKIHAFDVRGEKQTGVAL